MAEVIDLTSQDTMIASIQLVRMRAAVDANKRKTVGRGSNLNAGVVCLIAPSRQHPKKERQSNWGPAKIMAFIKAKADEHEHQKLLEDDRDLMEMAITRWTKVAREVQAASSTNFFKGFTACKEK
jgi:hypothetical protein